MCAWMYSSFILFCAATLQSYFCYHLFTKSTDFDNQFGNLMNIALWFYISRVGIKIIWKPLRSNVHRTMDIWSQHEVSNPSHNKMSLFVLTGTKVAWEICYFQTCNILSLCWPIRLQIFSLSMIIIIIKSTKILTTKEGRSIFLPTPM